MTTLKQRKHQIRFKKAVKACKGKPNYRSCFRKQLKN